MEHICIDPFLDFVDYGRLVATSRFGAYTVSHGTAVAELRMRCGLEVALAHICNKLWLNLVDYGRLVATGRVGFSGMLAPDDSSSESETITAVWMLMQGIV